MSEQGEFYEWGYRLSDGTEAWEVDHGTDGTWIPVDFKRGISHVDTDVDHPEDAIRKALKAAGAEGIVLRRWVTVSYGRVEEL